MLHRTRSRARRAGLDFNLTLEDIVIPSHCPVLGIELISNGYQPGIRGGTGVGRGIHPHAPTLDRINPRIGYVKGNVWVISWRANKIKADATLEELQKIVDAIKRMVIDTY